MHVIIGAYRGFALVSRALLSLEMYATGINHVTVVDDSGDDDTRLMIERHLGVEVVPVAAERVGYQAAMQRVCDVATQDGDQFVFWEEDFTLLEPIDFDAVGRILTKRPHLAQLALLRGPHFAIEHEHGGLLEALQARLGDRADLQMRDGVWEQAGTFTCNPAVWRQGIAKLGWPNVEWSEDAQRDRLVSRGYRFGFLPGIRVAHDGVRSGFGY